MHERQKIKIINQNIKTRWCLFLLFCIKDKDKKLNKIMKIKKMMINKASSVEIICRLTFDVCVMNSFIIDEYLSCFLNKIYLNILINEKEFQQIREDVCSRKEKD